MRTPTQIIGKDALVQLYFEGYVVLPAEPTSDMRWAGGEVNCPTETRTSAADYAVDVYKEMLRTALDAPTT